MPKRYRYRPFRIPDTWVHIWFIRWSMSYRIQRLRQGLCWEIPSLDPDKRASEHVRRIGPEWKPIKREMPLASLGGYRAQRSANATERAENNGIFVPMADSICDWGCGHGSAHVHRAEEAG